jgi:hypothetical protein
VFVVVRLSLWRRRDDWGLFVGIFGLWVLILFERERERDGRWDLKGFWILYRDVRIYIRWREEGLVRFELSVEVVTDGCSLGLLFLSVG